MWSCFGNFSIFKDTGSPKKWNWLGHSLSTSKRSWTRWTVLASSYLTLNIFLKLWPPRLITYKVESSPVPRLLHGTVPRATYGKTPHAGSSAAGLPAAQAWAEPPACVARSACVALFSWRPATHFRDVKAITAITAAFSPLVAVFPTEGAELKWPFWLSLFYGMESSPLTPEKRTGGGAKRKRRRVRGEMRVFWKSMASEWKRSLHASSQCGSQVTASPLSSSELVDCSQPVITGNRKHLTQRKENGRGWGWGGGQRKSVWSARD